MGKFLVRITVIFVAIYFVVSCILAQIGIDILNYSYTIMFELITVVYCYSEGKYHCKYMKYTALSIFLCDLLTRLDNAYDFLSVEAHNLIPIFILALGIGTSTFLAIKHFYLVMKLKKSLNANENIRTNR